MKNHLKFQTVCGCSIRQGVLFMASVILLSCQLACADNPFSSNITKDMTILSNNILGISLSNDFVGGSIRGMTRKGSDLTQPFRTYFIADQPELRQRRKGMIGKPEIDESGKYLSLKVERELGEFLHLRQDVIVPADKPYIYVKFTLTVLDDFAPKHIGYGISLDPIYDKRYRKQDSKGTGYASNEVNHRIDAVGQGGWLAYHSSKTGEGLGIIFINPENWDSFGQGFLALGRDRTGSDGERYFGLQLLHPCRRRDELKKGERYTLDLVFLSFNGDPHEEIERHIKRIKEKESFSTVNDGKKTVSAIYTEKPPAFNGGPGDSVWLKAPTYTNFGLSSARMPGLSADPKTEVKFLYDANHLYIGFVAFEPEMKAITVSRTGKDDGVWCDDCLEFFVSSIAEYETYHQFSVNALGGLGEKKWYRSIDGLSRGLPDWSSNAKLSVLRKDDHWQGQLVIPWKDIGIAAQAGRNVRIDVTRQRVINDGKSRTFSSLFVAPDGKWHQPWFFGYLNLLPISHAPSIAIMNQTAITEGEPLRLKVSQITNKPCKIIARIYLGEEQISATAREFTMPPKELTIPLTIATRGFQHLWLEMIDSVSGDILFANSYPLTQTRLAGEFSGVACPGGKGYSVGITSALNKVFIDDVLSPIPNRKSWELAAARNEHEPFQLVVSADGKKDGFFIDFSRLEHEQGKGSIPSSSFKVNPVHYVRIQHAIAANTYLGKWPDALAPSRENYELSPGNNPFWITLFVPENATPGAYTGKLSYGFRDGQTHQVPIKVTVWNFTLPNQSYLTVLAAPTPWGDRLTGRPVPGNTAEERLNNRFKYIEKYLENISEHRMNGLTHTVFWPSAKQQNGKFEIVKDARRTELFHRSLDLYDKLGIKYLAFPLYLGQTYWIPEGKGAEFGLAETPRRGIGGIEFFPDPDNSEFKKALSSFVKSQYDYFREIGLDPERIYFYHWDEPWLAPVWGGAKVAEMTYDKVDKMQKILKEAAPEIRVMQTSYPIPELYDSTDIWCPSHQHFYNARLAEKAKAGNEIWIYHNHLAQIPQEAVAPRLLGWICANYNIDAFLFWSINAWSRVKDPWNEPVPRLNGDGQLVYPLFDGDKFIVCNSIRWELIRDGLDDYDYLYMLKQIVESPASTAKDTALHAEAKEVLGRASGIPNRVKSQYFERGLGNEITGLRNEIGTLLSQWYSQ